MILLTVNAASPDVTRNVSLIGVVNDRFVRLVTRIPSIIHKLGLLIIYLCIGVILNTVVIHIIFIWLETQFYGYHNRLLFHGFNGRGGNLVPRILAYSFSDNSMDKHRRHLGISQRFVAKFSF